MCLATICVSVLEKGWEYQEHDILATGTFFSQSLLNLYVLPLLFSVLPSLQAARLLFTLALALAAMVAGANWASSFVIMLVTQLLAIYPKALYEILLEHPWQTGLLEANAANGSKQAKTNALTSGSLATLAASVAKLLVF